MATLFLQGKGFYGKVKRELAESTLSQALNILGHTPPRSYKHLAAVFHKISNTEQQRMIADWLADWLSEGKPGAAFFNRLLKGIHPNVRKKYIAQMLVNTFFRDVGWSRFREENGFNPPAVVLISPSMRCNYRCPGCYAANYTRDDDMSPELFDRIVSEAKAIGTRFFVILGGEPFIYPHLLDTFEKHNDVAFMVYTNGSLVDEKMAARLVELGNVAPQVSVDGLRPETDASRGPGAFDRAMRAMDNLRRAGCIFAFSTVPNRKNVDVITSDEFIDLMIEKGALYGWYFLYMPVGRDPDVSFMPTPQQRNQLRLAVSRFRETKPILVADFWNDAPLIGGCIAGGRIYLHVNHKGDVEPCIFCHWATHNLKDCSFEEALKSPFFAGLRKMQPFSYNTLRPCPIIDHPQVMRTALKKWGAYPTHEGAEATFTGKVAGYLDQYAAEVEELYAPIFDDEYKEWSDKWLRCMDHPPDKVEQRKKGYEARVEKIKRPAGRQTR